MFHVYILQSSADNRFYIGMTNDLSRRIHEHNSGQTPSTKGRGPFKLIYTESFGTRAEARKKEKFLKSGSGREWRNGIVRIHIPR